MFKHLHNHFQDNNLLSSLTHDVIPGDSIINQLIFLNPTYYDAPGANERGGLSSVTSAKLLIVILKAPFCAFCFF